MSGRKKKTKKSKPAQTLRERIMGEFSETEFAGKKRGVHVMTRLSDEIVEILDALVELEVFKSRSEAVAAYVEKGVTSRRALYDDVKNLAKQVHEMREKAKMMAQEAFTEVDR